MQLYSYAQTIEINCHNVLISQRQDNCMAVIWWLDYIKCNLIN